MAYATTVEVEAGYRTLTADEITMCATLLEEAGLIIDAYNSSASADAKNVVSCRMVRRAIGDSLSLPLGATQGSISAGGYSQSWTNASGSGELYLTRVEKKLLGTGNKIGSYSPIEGMVES